VRAPRAAAAVAPRVRCGRALVPARCRVLWRPARQAAGQGCRAQRGAGRGSMARWPACAPLLEGRTAQPNDRDPTLTPVPAAGARRKQLVFMQLQEAVSKSDGLSSIVTIRQDEMRHLQEQARLPPTRRAGGRGAARGRPRRGPRPDARRVSGRARCVGWPPAPRAPARPAPHHACRPAAQRRVGVGRQGAWRRAARKPSARPRARARRCGTTRRS